MRSAVGQLVTRYGVDPVWSLDGWAPLSVASNTLFSKVAVRQGPVSESKVGTSDTGLLPCHWVSPWMGRTGPELWLRRAGTEPWAVSGSTAKNEVCIFGFGGMNCCFSYQVGPWVGWTGPWPWLERLELKIWPYTNFLRHRYECLPSGPCAAGLLTDHRWEELGPSVVPFQNLLSCRHECFPWGPGTPGLLADYQCEESGTVYKAPSWFLGVQMGISPAWSLCQKTCS